MSVRDNPIVKAVIQAVDKTDNVLDLCCGVGDITQHTQCAHLTAVDAHWPYLKKYKERLPNALLLHADVTRVPYIWDSDKRFDVILLLDAVEHLEEQDAVAILDWSESAAFKKVIVFTPEGFVENHRTPPCWGIPGAEELQKHKSGFMPDFFIGRGYKLVAAVTNHVSKARQNLYIRERANGAP